MIGTNQEVAQNIVNQLHALANEANQIDIHPAYMPNYTNYTQALSILSTLRDAEQMGNPLVTEGTKYVACNGTWLNIFDNYTEADRYVEAADDTDARVFGTAIVMVEGGTDFVETLSASRHKREEDAAKAKVASMTKEAA